MPECGEIKQLQRYCFTCAENEKEEISDKCAECVDKSNWREIEE
jgi:hypothetical protein